LALSDTHSHSQVDKTDINNPRLELEAINDSLIDSELEKYISDDALNYLKVEALKIFQEVIDRQLTKAEEIYDRLTELPLDYGAIGMNTYSNFQSGQTVHAQFSKWHQLNLDLTGYWLIEFESKLDPSILFQIPYANASAMGFDLDGLPYKDSNQESLEPEITRVEQEQYPIVKLLKILGMTAQDFPQRLRFALKLDEVLGSSLLSIASMNLKESRYCHKFGASIMGYRHLFDRNGDFVE
jgi:hypothetical protein